MEKKLMDLVLPGRELVRASFREFTSLFIREDFPTFDLPAKATSGLSGGGNCAGRVALFKKEASIYLFFRNSSILRSPSVIFSREFA